MGAVESLAHLAEQCSALRRDGAVLAYGSDAGLASSSQNPGATRFEVGEITILKPKAATASQSRMAGLAAEIPLGFWEGSDDGGAGGGMGGFSVKMEFYG